MAAPHTAAPRRTRSTTPATRRPKFAPTVAVRTQGAGGRSVRAATVHRAALAMLRTLELPRAELSILLCGDREIHALNRDYRHKDKPTDVLAFALREGPGGELAGDVLGDVVISMETARRQAATHAHPVKTEVFTLLAHGLLHLLGWDHRTDAEDARMRKEVARLVDAAQSEDRTRR